MLGLGPVGMRSRANGDEFVQTPLRYPVILLDSGRETHSQISPPKMAGKENYSLVLLLRCYDLCGISCLTPVRIRVGLPLLLQVAVAEKVSVMLILGRPRF